MNKKPYARDWKIVYEGDTLEYSKEHNLYWKDGKVYAQISAAHGGLIGLGRRLKETMRNTYATT